MSKPIYLIFCYARSGGTLLNRFLVAQKNVVVLSEAHPIHNNKGGLYSIRGQMEKWYGVNISETTYEEEIKEVKQWCDDNNKILILRDWSYIDFSSSYLNKQNPPNQSTNYCLLHEKFDLQMTAFVRDGIDVYLSTKQPLKKFSQEYAAYVKYLISMKVNIVKYEEFIEYPQKIIDKVFVLLNGKFRENEISEDISSQNVIGDTGYSRGNQQAKIIKLPRRYAGYFKRKEINSNEAINQANIALGYSIGYASSVRETYFAYIKYEANSYIAKTKQNLNSKINSLCSYLITFIKSSKKN